MLPAEDASLDAAVFCLALMGTDYGAFLREAHRVLKPKGRLWIAEVRSRFGSAKLSHDTAGGDSRENYGPFTHALQELGFKVTRTDSSNRMFVVVEARKVGVPTHPERIKWPKLKPCVYKRR